MNLIGETFDKYDLMMKNIQFVLFGISLDTDFGVSVECVSRFFFEKKTVRKV